MRTQSDNPAPVPLTLRGRLELLIKSNHYVIGRVTLMDLTVIAVFFPAVAASCAACLGAGAWCSCLVSALFCLVTVRLRIRHSRFYDILRYKCGWYGVNLVTISRWDASSRTCSVCGEVNLSLKLSDRQWTCMCCGSHLDRDYNAAINIKNFGLRQTLPGDNREVTPVDCPPADDRRLAGLRSSGSVKQEKFRGVTDAPVL